MMDPVSRKQWNRQTDKIYDILERHAEEEDITRAQLLLILLSWDGIGFQSVCQHGRRQTGTLPE